MFDYYFRENKTTKNIYLNYIIDLYEYSFITKTRIQINKSKNKYYNSQQLIAFAEGDTDKELVVIEQNVNEFLKVVEYIWNLKPHNNYREEVHRKKNSSYIFDERSWYRKRRILGRI